MRQCLTHRGVTAILTVSYDKLFSKIRQSGLSNKEFMDKVGICKTTFYKIKNRKFVSLEVLLCICMFFSCDISDVVEFVEELM